MSALLNKRRFIVLAAASSIAACNPGPAHQPALHALTIHLDPDRTSELMTALESFAASHRFRWGGYSHPWGESTSTVFGMKRHDLEIHAHNPPQDTPVDVPVGETPRSIKDMSRFIVGFFPGAVSPTESELQAAMNAFTASAEAVESVHVEPYTP